MGKNSMFSSQGSFLIAVDVDSSNMYDIIDFIKAKKESMGIYDTIRYDLNNDGVVDEEDIAAIKTKLLQYGGGR